MQKYREQKTEKMTAWEDDRFAKTAIEARSADDGPG
jgi:hypothetical protein